MCINNKNLPVLSLTGAPAHEESTDNEGHTDTSADITDDKDTSHMRLEQTAEYQPHSLEVEADQPKQFQQQYEQHRQQLKEDDGEKEVDEKDDNSVVSTTETYDL